MPLCPCLYSCLLQGFVISASTECRLRPCTALPVPAPAGDACCQVPVPCCIPLQCAAAIKQQQQCCLSPTLPRPSRSPGPTPHMPLSRSSTTKETPRPQHDEHPPPHTHAHTALLLPQQALLTWMHTRPRRHAAGAAAAVATAVTHPAHCWLQRSLESHPLGTTPSTPKMLPLPSTHPSPSIKPKPHHAAAAVSHSDA